MGLTGMVELGKILSLIWVSGANAVIQKHGFLKTFSRCQAASIGIGDEVNGAISVRLRSGLGAVRYFGLS